MTSASPPEFTVSLLTDDEKWYFDNFGYLVLREAVPGTDVATMLSELDRWLHSSEEPPAPLKRGRQNGATHRENVSHPQYASAAFSRLNTNSEILRVVSGMMMGCPRLMHMVATKMWCSPAEQPPPSFHRDTDGFVFPLGFRNPHNDYQASGGELYASHVATWVALVDVPQNTGFALVPGKPNGLLHRTSAVAASRFTRPLRQTDWIRPRFVHRDPQVVVPGTAQLAGCPRAACVHHGAVVQRRRGRILHKPPPRGEQLDR